MIYPTDELRIEAIELILHRLSDQLGLNSNYRYFRSPQTDYPDYDPDLDRRIDALEESLYSLVRQVRSQQDKLERLTQLVRKLGLTGRPIDTDNDTAVRSRHWVASEDVKSASRSGTAPLYVSGEIETPRHSRRPQLTMAKYQGRNPRRLVLDLVNYDDGKPASGGTVYRTVRFEQPVRSGEYDQVQINHDGERLTRINVRNAGGVIGIIDDGAKLPDGDDLAYGSSGRRVRILQQILRAAGYTVAVDGDLDRDTREAVISFQKKEGLKPDGIVGPITRKRLNLVDVSRRKGGNGGNWRPGLFHNTDKRDDDSWGDLPEGDDLELGSHGERVRLLQSILAGAGYGTSIDGDFGDETRQAVMQFQKDEGIKPDGVVGPVTRSHLNRLDNSWRRRGNRGGKRGSWTNGLFGGAKSSGSRIGDTNLEQGSSGESVSTLQQILSWAGYKVSVDGDFGRQTRDAVIDFQKAEGLKPDGVVGPETRSALNHVWEYWSPSATSAKWSN